MKLLAVEDNREDQKFLRFYLRRNFEVDVVDSADEFFEKFNSNEYEVLLFDISIRGELTGIDLIREVREKLKSKIPIVVLTAHAYAGERNEAFNAGANYFLVKPTPRDELMETILKAVDEKEKF